MTSLPRILVVDDEPLLLESMKDALGKKGYDVKLGTNGADALSLIERGEVDAVITDMRMPEMDGLELLRAATQIEPPDLAAARSGRQKADRFLVEPTRVPIVGRL